jgi:ABC-2 type transport system ATP-binding protein
LSESGIITENLTKRFEDTVAIENLNLQIQKGELFGLLGPNGAGKTTTINMLCGLQKPTNGSASVGGFDVQKETAKIKELIGVCPQETPLYSYLTARENIELFGKLHAMPKNKLKENTNLLLDKMSLTEDAKRRAGKFSGGMKRRLSLVMALVHNPEIVFLDDRPRRWTHNHDMQSGISWLT